MYVYRGVLCAGGFERGSATYWQVRRDGRQYLAYRTSVAVTLIGEYGTPDGAYAEYFKHVEDHGPTLESSMGG